MAKKTDFGWFVFVFLFYFNENIILSVTFSETEGIKLSYGSSLLWVLFRVLSIFCPETGDKVMYSH